MRAAAVSAAGEARERAAEMAQAARLQEEAVREFVAEKKAAQAEKEAAEAAAADLCQQLSALHSAHADLEEKERRCVLELEAERTCKVAAQEEEGTRREVCVRLEEEVVVLRKKIVELEEGEKLAAAARDERNWREREREREREEERAALEECREMLALKSTTLDNLQIEARELQVCMWPHIHIYRSLLQ